MMLPWPMRRPAMAVITFALIAADPHQRQQHILPASIW
jgi:hypothetical protein